MKRHFLLIASLATLPKPTTKQLTGATGIPESSLKRYLAELRRDYKMKIRHIREKGAHGRVGHFQIEDWGILNESSFLLHYRGLLTSPCVG